MEFEYISAKEAATKIGVTVRWIQQLCKDGKVEGAKRFGTQDIWLVPIKWVEARLSTEEGEMTKQINCCAVLFLELR